MKPEVPERAVCVCFDGDRVLLMRRRRADREYTVLPGGGVQSGEAPRQAAVRELEEETGLRGVVVEELAVVDHDDRRAHYFRVRVAAGQPVLGGPEADAQAEDNRHTPIWVDMINFASEPLVPAEARVVVTDAFRGDSARRRLEGST